MIDEQVSPPAGDIASDSAGFGVMDHTEFPVGAEPGGHI